MIETLKNAWKIVDIRKKIFFTIFIIILFRIGAVIPVPFIDYTALKNSISSTGSQANDFFNYLSVLTGGGLEYGAIFAMSVTPYINSSIIIQLLTVVITPWQRWAEQGEEGRKKLAQVTRYATVILGLIQAGAYYYYLQANNFVYFHFHL